MSYSDLLVAEPCGLHELPIVGLDLADFFAHQLGHTSG